MLDNREELQETLLLLEEKKDYRKICTIFEELSPVDTAELFEEFEDSTRVVLMKLLPKDIGADVFSYLDGDTQENILKNVTDEQAASILKELSTDDAADALSEIPANLVQRILKNADAQTRGRINTFLNYPDNCVGSIMTSEYTSLNSRMTVKDALEYIRSVSDRRETVYTCYVLGARRELLGVVDLCDILACRDDFELVENLMETMVVKVETKEDKEEAARLTKKYDLVALPVVDSENRLVGIVTIDDIVDVIEEMTTRDIEQMAAIAHVETPYLKTGVLSIVKARIPWLLVLMIAGMLNGLILGEYEIAISALPMLVTFMPMLTGTGGNSGSQTTATIIRSMTLGELTLRDSLRVMWKEIRVAFVVGGIFAIINFLRIVLFSNDPDKILIGIVLSVSMMVTVLMAKALGAVLPLIAKRLKFDPAVVASPMITTIVDALSLVFYFSFAMIVLAHRL